MANSKLISVRAPEEIHDRLEQALERARDNGIEATKTDWVLAAIVSQLDQDEEAASQVHIPEAVLNVLPQRKRRGVLYPPQAQRSLGGRLDRIPK